jgi:hypothetical protein
MSVKYPEHQATGFALHEADTCRKRVIPKLQLAGWDNGPHPIAEQRTITDGDIFPVLLKVPPISGHGNVNEIIATFGETDKLRNCREPITIAAVCRLEN